MNSSTNFDTVSTSTLLGELVNFFEETHCFSYKGETDRNSIILALQNLDMFHDKMNSTFEGREIMRERGWVIEETDPVLIKKAAELQAVRDEMFESSQSY